MLTQTQIAAAWGPACRKVARPTIALHGHGRVTVDPRIVDAVKALNACLVRWNYRTRWADTGAYVCRQKVSGNGWSNHSYGTALDLNWQTNPYGSRLITDMPAGMRDAIKAIRTNNGKQVWGWGGDWRGNKDAMHWEIVCKPADLATGIRGSTAAASPPPKSEPAPMPHVPPPYTGPTPEELLAIHRLHQEEQDMIVIRNGKGIAHLVNNRAVVITVQSLIKVREAYKAVNRPLPELQLGSDQEWTAYTGLK